MISFPNWVGYYTKAFRLTIGNRCNLRHHANFIFPVSPFGAYGSTLWHAAMADRIFRLLTRSAEDASSYFQLPTDRVVWTLSGPLQWGAAARERQARKELQCGGLWANKLVPALRCAKSIHYSARLTSSGGASARHQTGIKRG
jgi:hypothetical protein